MPADNYSYRHAPQNSASYDDQQESDADLRDIFQFCREYDNQFDVNQTNGGPYYVNNRDPNCYSTSMIATGTAAPTYHRSGLQQDHELLIDPMLTSQSYPGQQPYIPMQHVSPQTPNNLAWASPAASSGPSSGSTSTTHSRAPSTGAA